MHDPAYLARLRRRMRWRMLLAYLTPLALISVIFYVQYSTTPHKGIQNHLRSIADQ